MVAQRKDQVMPFNEEFYKKYRSYLLEPAIRHAHNLMFESFHRICGGTPLRIIDLGCGTSEFRTHSYVSQYKGVDLYPLDDHIIVADFTRTPPDALAKMCEFRPNAFISLFASEPLLEDRKRYELYEQVFRQIPSLHFGMVSGFFYRNRSYYHSVEESGGIRSFQTIEKQSDVMNSMFTEFRSYIDAPSEFFGKDVVEVWKFFRRASDAVHPFLLRDGVPGSHHRDDPRPQDVRVDSPAAVQNGGDSGWVGADLRPVVDLPQMEEPSVSAMMETFWGIFLLCFGVFCVVAGAAIGDFLGMAIGGVIGLLLVRRFMSSNSLSWLARLWNKVQAALLRVRKFILHKSDPDYIPRPEPKRSKPWFDKVHAVIYRTYTKICCYYNLHEPINVMENNHLFTRCEHCNQFIEAVLWNVRKTNANNDKDERKDQDQGRQIQGSPGQDHSGRESRPGEGKHGEHDSPADPVVGNR
jgi:hypothetical protein